MNPLNIQTAPEGTFVTYQLGAGEMLDRMTMGMLRNNKIKGLVPPEYTQVDKERWLKYDITSMVPIGQYVTGVLSRKKALDLFSQLAETFLLAEDYMIDAAFIILDSKFVFVNKNTGKIGIICLPLAGFVGNVTLRDFVGNVTKTSRFNQQENCDYVTRILNFVNGTEFSIDGFKKLLDQLTSESIVRVQKQHSDGFAEAGGQMAVAVESVANMVSNSAGTIGRGVEGQAQGIWGANSGMGGGMQPNNPKQMSGSGAETSAGIDAPGEKPVKEKKGFFGKRKKKDKSSDMPPAEGISPVGGIPPIAGMDIPGMAVPGMVVPGMDKPVMAPPPMPSKPPVKSGSPLPPDSTKPSKLPVPPNPPKPPVIAKPPRSLKQEAVPIAGGMPSPKIAGIAEQISGGPRQTTRSGDKPEWSISPEFENGVGVSDSTIMLNLNEEKPASLVRVRTGEKTEIKEDELIIGKDPNSVDYCVYNNTTISRVHARILRRGKQYVIQDNHSMNHTYVDQVQLFGGQEAPIQDGCRIRLSDEEFIFFE